MSNQDISIWLIPEESQRDTLQKVIDELAKKWKSFAFIPHITPYYLGNAVPLAEVVLVVEELAETTTQMELFLEKVSFEDKFTQTLFVKYVASGKLLELNQQLRSRFPKVPYNLAPHLSLLYKEHIPTQNKQALARACEPLVPGIITLDKLAIITKPGGIIQKENDILEWSISKQIQLR